MSPTPREYYKKAQFQFQAAHHLLHNTYPLLKDPKLFLGILTNLTLATQYAIDAILQHKYEQKEIPNYGNTFNSKILTLRSKVLPQGTIKPAQITKILEMQNILEEHKKSPMEFQKERKFVICDDQYNHKILSAESMKEFVQETEQFITNIKEEIDRNT